MVVCEWHVRTYDEDVDEEHAYFVDLNDMLGILGYKDRNGIHYQYKIPDSNLDFGLKELRNDQDERTPKKSSIDLVKDRTPMKSNRLPLLLMGDAVGNNKTRNENYVEMENDEDSDIAKDIYSDMEVSVNRPSGSCLKNIGGKWVKQKSPQKPVSNGNLKNIGGKWIKVTSPQKQGSALKKNNGSALNNNSGSTINKIGVKSIKVEGTKGH
ncbi:hypothetical protein Tco_0914101 [Tanacetum coccineum]